MLLFAFLTTLAAQSFIVWCLSRPPLRQSSWELTMALEFPWNGSIALLRLMTSHISKAQKTSVSWSFNTWPGFKAWYAAFHPSPCQPAVICFPKGNLPNYKPKPSGGPSEYSIELIKKYWPKTHGPTSMVPLLVDLWFVTALGHPSHSVRSLLSKNSSILRCRV